MQIVLVLGLVVLDCAQSRPRLPCIHTYPHPPPTHVCVRPEDHSGPCKQCPLQFRPFSLRSLPISIDRGFCAAVASSSRNSLLMCGFASPLLRPSNRRCKCVGKGCIWVGEKGRQPAAPLPPPTSVPRRHLCRRCQAATCAARVLPATSTQDATIAFACLHLSITACIPVCPPPPSVWRRPAQLKYLTGQLLCMLPCQRRHFSLTHSIYTRPVLQA